MYKIDKALLKTLPFIIAVDFDGCLVEDAYPGIGPERKRVGDAVRRLQAYFPQIKWILWTCRDNNSTDRLLDKAIDYCSHKLALRFDAVNRNIDEVLRATNGNDCRKVYANIYLDDRNLPLNELDEYFRMCEAGM